MADERPGSCEDLVVVAQVDSDLSSVLGRHLECLTPNQPAHIWPRRTVPAPTAQASISRGVDGELSKCHRGWRDASIPPPRQHDGPNPFLNQY